MSASLCDLLIAQRPLVTSSEVTQSSRLQAGDAKAIAFRDLQSLNTYLMQAYSLVPHTPWSPHGKVLKSVVLPPFCRRGS